MSRAFATLVQLVSTYTEEVDLQEDKHAYSIIKCIIKDYPSYPFRSLYIDGAKHYLPLKHVRKTIDALAITKFNVLHFHVTDDESFPLRFMLNP